MNNKILNVLSFSLALLVFIPAVLEILFSLIGETYIWGKITFQGDFMLWRGLILLGSSLFYLLAIRSTSFVQKQAQIVLASLMIWIIGGIEIISLILGSIPGGEGQWINSLDRFLGSYSGPFIPSLFLLPISIALVLYIFDQGKEVDTQ